MALVPGEAFDERVRSVSSRISGVAIRAGADEVIGHLDAAERLLSRDQSVIVAIGEFSSGKSSLLNALLEEVPGLFPVDSYVSTRVLALARWGDPETITLTLEARGGEPAEERAIGRCDLRGYISEAEVLEGDAHRDAERVTRVTIRTPSEKLSDGVTLIDTPGIGGVFRGHEAVTIGVLPQADVALYVTDATRPPLPSELAFISRVAQAVDAERCPERLMIVVNKTDQVADPDDAVRELRSRLSAAGCHADRSAVLPVSARSRLLTLSGTPQPSAAAVRFADFERRLRTGSGRVRLILRAGSALEELSLAVDSLLAPVHDAISALNAKDAAAREELATAAKARQAESLALAEGSAEWPEDLRLALAGIAATLRAKVSSELGTLWRDLRRGYRGNPAWLDDPQLILDEMATRLAVLAAGLSREASEGTASACEEIAARTGLRVRRPVLPGLPLMPLPELTGSAIRKAVAAPPAADSLSAAFEAAVSGARAGASWGDRIGAMAWDLAAAEALRPSRKVITMAKGAVESITTLSEGRAANNPGAVTGRIVGVLVGAVLAFTGKTKQIQAMAGPERIAALDELFRPWEEEQREFLSNAVQDLVSVCTTGAEGDLRARIARRQAECAAAEAEIAAAMSSGAELAASTATLTARGDELEELRRDIAALGTELLGRLSEPAS